MLFGGNKRHEIVGVVADARYRSVEQPADPTFYLPLEQNDERWPFLSFTVWTDGSDGAPRRRRGGRCSARPFARPIRSSRSRASASFDEICRAVDGRAAVQHLDGRVVRRDRAGAGRGRHLRRDGVRGDQPDARAGRARRARRGRRDLIGWCSGQGLLLTLLATAIGLGAAVLLTRYMASLLFGVAPRDPLTFALVAGVLASVAIAATLIPARQADAR